MVGMRELRLNIHQSIKFYYFGKEEHIQALMPKANG
jgi:hypothetical protein